MNIELKDLLLILLGIPPAIVISHYYFKKSITKSLTPYLMFHASPMSGMGAAVRSELDVEFKGRKVGNLIEAQFLIINDGSKALRDVIEPLSLRWPESVRVLDAQVVQTQSADIKVTADLVPSGEGPNRLTLSFDLLNSREWFILKVIADGPPDAVDWAWSIVVDELPRSLPLRRLTLQDLRNLPESPIERKFAAALLIVSAAFVAAWIVWLNPATETWKKSVEHDSSLLVFAASALRIFVGVCTLFFTAAAFAFFGKLTKGFKFSGRSLPSLPKEVVADVWRGHTAQPDAVERLKKASEKS